MLRANRAEPCILSAGEWYLRFADHCVWACFQEVGPAPRADPAFGEKP